MQEVQCLRLQTHRLKEGVRRTQSEKNKTSENTCLRSDVRRTPSFGLSGCRSEHALHIPPAPRADAGFRPLSLDSTA